MIFTTPVLANPSAPDVEEATSYEIVDGKGNVIYSKDANKQMEPASITKVMTAVVALDQKPNLDKICTIEPQEYQVDAQLVGYTKDDTPSLKDLMLGLLVFSGNDCADQIALNTTGSIDAFVAKMNEKAKELGMNNTHFANTHGLSQDGHYTTAHDLCILARYAYQNYPFIREAVRTRQVELKVNGIMQTFRSTDRLMDTYPGLLGIKTGVVESGTTFMGASTKNGLYLFSAVLGCKTSQGRFSDTAALMDWAYSNYYHKKLFASDAWVIRVQNSAYNFAIKALVKPIFSATGYVAPDSNVSFSTTLVMPNTLLAQAENAGYSIYKQDGRFIVGITYTTELVPQTHLPKTLFNPVHV